MNLEFLQPSSWARAADQRPERGIQTLHSEATVHSELDRTFAFFADAQNLERLTPPWLSFRIATPLPIQMKEGTLIDYVIELYGVPIPWRTRIDVWEPGVRFVDRQIAGPYRWWHHEHRFESFGVGTRVIDHVEYLPRAAWLSSWLVNRDVQRIFNYRQTALASLLTPEVNLS
jgi:ligand-binding SRPBCC domain-containing protein